MSLVELCPPSLSLPPRPTLPCWVFTRLSRGGFGMIYEPTYSGDSFLMRPR